MVNGVRWYGGDGWLLIFLSRILHLRDVHNLFYIYVLEFFFFISLKNIFIFFRLKTICLLCKYSWKPQMEFCCCCFFHTLPTVAACLVHIIWGGKFLWVVRSSFNFSNIKIFNVFDIFSWIFIFICFILVSSSILLLLLLALSFHI